MPPPYLFLGKETSISTSIPTIAAHAKHPDHGSFEYPLRRRSFISDESTDAFSAAAGKTDAHVLVC